MKVYIAAPYPCRDAAIALMHALEDAGIEVTSRWLKAPDELADQFAREGLADVEAADALVALNPAGWENVGTGRHVELGYALHGDKRVVLVGQRSNIFHYLNHVKVVDTTEEAIAWLKQ